MAIKTIHDLYSDWPPKFRADQIDELSKGIFRWRTIKNLRCKGKIPDTCFFKVSPRKILILRDEFLAWAETYVTV